MGQMFNRPYKIYPQEAAAYALANAQHAPGVTVRIGSDYRVEYVRPDGTLVPDYDYFLQQEMEGGR